METRDVLIFYNHQRTVPIQCILDTGADLTLFHGDIGDALRIPVKNGQQYLFGGVQGVNPCTGYIHTVRLQVAGDSFDARVVFSYDIAAAGILGQMGFFDKFIATFDWTPNPPLFELERISRN